MFVLTSVSESRMNHVLTSKYGGCPTDRYIPIFGPAGRVMGGSSGNSKAGAHLHEAHWNVLSR